MNLRRNILKKKIVELLGFFSQNLQNFENSFAKFALVQKISQENERGSKWPSSGAQVKNALFNSIQSPVPHWAPTPGRNPLSAPDVTSGGSVVFFHGIFSRHFFVSVFHLGRYIP